mmetsp:Transcript_26176/g.63088  ORF Transcript_26176/g.63088 Transcript_26176/m.63088 type:complete len:781 (-) Transcript_26176:128-2470(-)
MEIKPSSRRRRAAQDQGQESNPTPESASAGNRSRRLGVPTSNKTTPNTDRNSSTMMARIIRATVITLVLVFFLERYHRRPKNLSDEDFKLFGNYLHATKPNGKKSLLSSPEIHVPSNPASVAVTTTIKTEATKPLQAPSEPKTEPTESNIVPASIRTGNCEEDWSLKKKAGFVEYHSNCGEMTRMGVVVGKTWGSLPQSRWGEWKDRRCDQYHRWHRDGKGTTGWHEKELLGAANGKDVSECCRACQSDNSCKSFAIYNEKCLRSSRAFSNVGTEGFPFPHQEYTLTNCNADGVQDKFFFDRNGMYLRESAGYQNGGLIYHTFQSEESPKKNWGLILQLQLLPALHFNTSDGGETFTGGFKGQASGMILTSTQKSDDSAKTYCASTGTGVSPKRPPKTASKTSEGFEKACPDFGAGGDDNAILQKRLLGIGYGENMIKIKDMHPGWAAPACGDGEKSSRLLLLLPATLRSFEHLVEYLNQWTTASNDECSFIAVAVDPNVDISGDPAVKDFSKVSPDYGTHVLAHAQRVMKGRLAYLTFERNRWNCVGGPRCQRYAIPLAYEVLKWALCALGSPIRDHDVVVKGRADIHYREAIDFAPLAEYVQNKPQTIFWMRKFKSRWSNVDDPTDQVIIGGKKGLEAWIDYFSFTLRECGVVKSDWIGIPGVSHRLINPDRFHFCMVRHTGIMDDSTKSCNTQPYPGSHPGVTIFRATGPAPKSDITKDLVCFTRYNGGDVPSGATTERIMWTAVTGAPICERDGPFPWSEDPINVYTKANCDTGVI